MVKFKIENLNFFKIIIFNHKIIIIIKQSMARKQLEGMTDICLPGKNGPTMFLT